ncbi:MAG: HEAT repeat domain-containing protein [Leptospiraceae bacterium]|nr:HEAT repeat domain-containing protein [Leptospiraceae bacterium]
MINKLFPIFALFILIISINAEDLKDPSFLFIKDAKKMQLNIAQAIADESEEEEDDVSSNAGAKTSSEVKTKGSSKPNVPSSHNQWTKVEVQEVSPEKRNNLIREGLAAIKMHEDKNRNSSVKHISRILLSNPYPEVRTEAARALGRMGKGLKALHKAIKSDGYEVRQQAYQSIEIIGSRYSLKYFTSGVKSTDPLIKKSSYRGIGKTKSSIGRDIILKKGLSEEDPEVLSAALTGLGYYSKKEDLGIFQKFLDSDSEPHIIGAIQGLGYSTQPLAINMLLNSLEKNPKYEPEVINSLSKKRNLASTLVLIRLMNSSKNENYQAMIQKELYARKAFGRYAIVTNNLASIRKSSKARADKVAVLRKGEVAKIRKVTEKLFKAKMNGDVKEDRYYLLQVYNKKTTSKKNVIIEGWVFGPKIKVISVSDPLHSKVVSSKSKPNVPDETEVKIDEDSEDEFSRPSDFNKKDSAKKDETKKPEEENKTPSKDEEFYDFDEDEDE